MAHIFVGKPREMPITFKKKDEISNDPSKATSANNEIPECALG